MLSTFQLGKGKKWWQREGHSPAAPAVMGEGWRGARQRSPAHISLMGREGAAGTAEGFDLRFSSLIGLLTQISSASWLLELVPQRRNHEQRNAWQLESFIPPPSHHSPEQEPHQSLGSFSLFLVLLFWLFHTPQVGFGECLVDSVNPHCEGVVTVHRPQSAPAF